MRGVVFEVLDQMSRVYEINYNCYFGINDSIKSIFFDTFEGTNSDSAGL